MVCETVKPSFRPASCWSVEVVKGAEAVGQFGLEGASAGEREEGCDAEVGFGGEGVYFVLAVDDETHGHTLHAAGREGGFDFLPEHGRELETHEAVEDAARLLGVDEVDVDVARVGDGVEDGVLGDFVEDDAAGVFRFEPEHFVEVPRDGLTLAVFIGGEPYGLGLRGGFLELGHERLLVGGNLIDGFELLIQVYGNVALTQVADVSVARHHLVVFSKKFFYGFRLCRRLHYHEILYHNQ